MWTWNPKGWTTLIEAIAALLNLLLIIITLIRRLARKRKRAMHMAPGSSGQPQKGVEDEHIH